MSIINNTLLLGSGDEGYNLTRSLRFRSSASAYLNRTPASVGNQKTWTWSNWVKRGTLSTQQSIFDIASGSAGVPRGGFYFETDNTLNFLFNTSGSSFNAQLVTTQVFRDPSAYYHIVFSVDTTQATAANRIKVYLNGTQITAFSTATYPAQNTDFPVNSTALHNIGRLANNASYFDGYLTEVNFIDGQALTPSSFGETDPVTGVWKPKRYAGTYGTNGFYLPFTDNSALTTSSNAGLGKDFSGNGNYWTTNNISITSGVTYDSMTDVPTLTSATAANYCVWNTLDKGANNTLSNGNLQFQISSGNQGTVRSTFSLPSTGKWYWEVTMTALGPLLTGIATSAATLTNYVGSDAYGWGYNSGDGLVYNNGTTIRANATLAAGDIVGVAFDSGAGSLSFYKNNVLQTTAITGFTPATVNYFIAAGTNGGAGILNCGQRPFTYTPPTGYVALNTYNLPTSTIVKGNTVMDATLYTGNGSTQTITNAAGFKPDLVWYKGRSTAYNHSLFDSVRGATKQLISNTIDAEATLSGVTAFNSNGFSLGSDANGNNNGTTYVAWQWQAGQGTTSTNTSGTITSSVSVNASAGFSVVTYTGNNTNPSTVGHGLGVAPSLIIVKPRNTATYNWNSYHISLGNTQFIALNTDSAASSAANLWNNTSPTSTVFTINAVAVNTSATTYVAYCWTPIAGYSAFGSYTGNGSTDGPFVYLGFRPKFILAKKISSSGDWNILDGQRDPYNAVGTYLNPNLSAAEGANASTLDFTANGFKLRQSYGNWNTAGETYIYACFAENPFRNSLAR